jgi:hypothetical protein
MDSRKKWKSPQAIIVMILILLIFTYIGIDMAMTKPKIMDDIKDVKAEYVELSGYLDKKLPEIDSTLRIQADQISSQGSQIDSLNQTVKKIIRE